MPKLAAVSLMINYDSLSLKNYRDCKNQFEATPIYIEKKEKNRIKEIKENIIWAQKNYIDLLLFPGWSLATPHSLEKIAPCVGKNLYVILEILKGANEFRNAENEGIGRFRSENFCNDSGTFIINNKRVLFGPIFQVFSQGKALRTKSLNGDIRQLKSELSNPVIWDQRDSESYKGIGQGRWLNLNGKGKYLILLCGEANLTNDKTADWLKESKDFGFNQINYRMATAIINPAHTPPNKYMNTKREIWSKLTKVPLIHCANINGQLRDSKGNVKIKSNYDGTQVFINGKAYRLFNDFKQGIKHKNVNFVNKRISIHNSHNYQRAIIYFN